MHFKIKIFAESVPFLFIDVKIIPSLQYKCVKTLHFIRIC